MLTLFKNVYITARDRGPLVLLSASLNDLNGRFQKHVLGRRFLKKRIHDYQMLLDLDDRGISRGLTLFGTREVDHKIILEKVLKPGMMVFDIGANIGYYAIMEKRLVGPKGRLIAIEPSPSNVELLRKNLELNSLSKEVPVLEAAVSDQPGERTFFLATHSNLGTFHNVGTGIEHLSGKTVDVKTLTVPELAERYGRPDLIRMDVEGHEVEILRGMLEAIEAGTMAPMVIFETHLSRYSAEHDMAGVLRRLFDLGYHVRYVGSSSERGTKLISSRGYKGSDPIPTDGMKRVIFENISNADALDFICKTGGARTVLIQKKQAY